MALTKTLTLDSGVSVSGAYIRIDSVTGSKDSLNLTVYEYASQALFEAGNSYLEPAKTYSFTPSVEDTATNFIKQGYVYLKTLDAYSDATDC